MRILLADKQARVRYAMRVLLKDAGDVFLEAADTHQVFTRTGEMKPDLVLLDWALPGLSLSSLIDKLRRICPQAAVIVLGSRPEARDVALAAGADAFISKADPPDRLLVLVSATREKVSQKRDEL